MVVPATFSRVVAVSVAFALLFSLGLHTVDVEHVHPGQHNDAHSGDGQSTLSIVSHYVHATEQKFFFVLTSVWSFFTALLFGVFCFEFFHLSSWLKTYGRHYARMGRRHDFYQELFSGGILHSKTCG